MITKEMILAKISEGIKLTTNEKLAWRNIQNADPAINITDNMHQIILGSLLGDGSIIRKRTNCTLTMVHSIVQQEYILYKKKLLEKEGLRIKYSEVHKDYNHTIDGRKIKFNGQCRLVSQVNIALNKYRDDWYIPKKQVPNSIIELKPLGLAIWYMDDGTLHYPTGIYLSTNGFNHESQIKLVQMLENNFDITAKIHKNKDKEILYIVQKDKQKFIDIIKPYVCPSMNYKIIGHNKQGELLET
jgi:hypothetical protein